MRDKDRYKDAIYKTIAWLNGDFEDLAEALDRVLDGEEFYFTQPPKQKEVKNE